MIQRFNVFLIIIIFTSTITINLGHNAEESVDSEEESIIEIPYWGIINSTNNPSKRCYHEMIYSKNNNEIFLFGGSSDGHHTSQEVYKYSFQNNNWILLKNTEGPPLKYSNRAVFDSKNQSVYFLTEDHLWLYSIQNNNWTKQKHNISWAHNYAWDIDESTGIIYTVVGHDYYKMNAWYYQISNKTWIKINTTNEAPRGRRGFRAVFNNKTNELFFFGGFNDQENLNDFYKINFNNYTWTKLNTEVTPAERVGYSMWLDNNEDKIYIYGGCAVWGPYFRDTWYYNIENNTWIKINSEVRPNRYESGGANDDQNGICYFFGGANDYQLNIMHTLNSFIYIKYKNLEPKMKKNIQDIYFYEDDEKNSDFIIDISEYFEDDQGFENLSIITHQIDNISKIKPLLNSKNLSFELPIPNWYGKASFFIEVRDQGNDGIIDTNDDLIITGCCTNKIGI